MSFRFGAAAGLVGSMLLVIAPGRAAADRRAFTHTYEYMTMPEGETELELYTTQSRSTFDAGAVHRFEMMFEIEHGITERWDVSLYHVFEQSTGPSPGDDQALRLSEMKLRSRYRFSERGEWPVDLTLYAEAVKEFGKSEYELELKPIVARDFGLVTVALNPIAALKLSGGGGSPELELAWAGGATYEVSPTWKVGAETWGQREDDAAGDPQIQAWAGPAASWAPSENLWVTVTGGYGLNEASDKVTVRGLIGLHL